MKRRRHQACQCSASAAAFVIGVRDDLEMVAYIDVCPEHAGEVVGLLKHDGFDDVHVFDMAAQQMWLEEMEQILGERPEKLQLASVA